VADLMPPVFSLYIAQFVDSAGNVLKSKIDSLGQEQQCPSFAFEQCSLYGLVTDYPKIFELENQELVR
jgi:hypothetical protein